MVDYQQRQKSKERILTVLAKSTRNKKGRAIKCEKIRVNFFFFDVNPNRNNSFYDLAGTRLIAATVSQPLLVLTVLLHL